MKTIVAVCCLCAVVGGAIGAVNAGTLSHVRGLWNVSPAELFSIGYVPPANWRNILADALAAARLEFWLAAAAAMISAVVCRLGLAAYRRITATCRRISSAPAS